MPLPEYSHIAGVQGPSGVPATLHARPAVLPDFDFEARWAAWVARGHAHEQHVRRKLVVLGGLLAMGAALIYGVLHV